MEKLDVIETKLHQMCREIPYAKNILLGLLAEMGDIMRFDDAREIQKVNGLGLADCSSGKHRGRRKSATEGANG